MSSLLISFLLTPIILCHLNNYKIDFRKYYAHQDHSSSIMPPSNSFKFFFFNCHFFFFSFSKKELENNIKFKFLEP